MFWILKNYTFKIRMKHWMQIIAQRQQSGLTVKESAQQDIPIKQYYYFGNINSAYLFHTGTGAGN